MANLKVVQAENIKSVRRRPRRPQHKFCLESLPFEIVPFMIAPVLPGESLQNALLQSRVVTDPIKNRLIGWHKEYYWFYVPHISLVEWDQDGVLKAMMLDPTTDVSGLRQNVGNTPNDYTFKDGMGFVSACLDKVVAEFFRDEDERNSSWSDPWSTNYPLAQIDQQQWYNSFAVDGVGAADAELPGEAELEAAGIPEEYSPLYDQWLIMRDAGLVDVDYDDFLRSYGVDIPKAEEVDKPAETAFRPELLRFVRKWQYPSNVIDPTDGSATSAVSWSIAERMDKVRFFKYPGFIFGVTVTRPKIYLGNQKGSAVGFLDDALAWLPGVLRDAAYTSVKKLTHSATTGILQNQSADYWIDVKDLFLYGDQFINVTPTVAGHHALAVPGDGGPVKYLTEAMIKSLFVTAGSEYVREDGICHLNVLGRLTETTP